eukprot:jgi/Hompol1/5786/HPOL_004698-RA
MAEQAAGSHNAQQDAQPDVQQKLLTALASLTKSAAFISASEVAFIKSSVPAAGRSLDAATETLFSMISQAYAYGCMPPAKDYSNYMANAEQLLHPDDLVDRFGVVSDVVDNLLEKADTFIDSHFQSRKKNHGLVVNPKSLVARQHQTQQQGVSSFASSKKQPHSGSGIAKPQLLFADEIDNSNTPFVPKITFKYNARVPLDHESADLATPVKEHLATLGSSDVPTSENHPYKYEIENIVYPSSLFEKRAEILYRPLESTPLTWVETVEQLERMANLLDAATEIAVDLEHHDYRSFQGITCLMQISTRSEDFIVDTLALRNSLQILNSSFTNPNIIKVFHGAESDIQWLQRDLGLYVVGLFDTYHASHALGLEGHGLAFLLKLYCGVDTDKKYQLADWRIRPIPEEMMIYARTDTHYLLYIFDRMRNDLIDQSNPATLNLVNITLERSAETSLNVYVKDTYAEDGSGSNGWLNLLSKFQSSFNEENFAVFKAIHSWRDHIARKEDESLRYVIPNHLLQTISRVMPSDAEEIIACCSPTPALVRLYAKELAELIRNTVAEARLTAAAKQAELARLKEEFAAKQKEYRDKIAAGRTHIRFDPPQQSSGAADTATLQSSGDTKTPVTGVPDINKSGAAPDAKTIQEPHSKHYSDIKPAVSATSKSQLFGFVTPIDNQDAVQLHEAKQKAAAIRSRLILQAPSFVQAVKRKIDEINKPLAPVAVEHAPSAESAKPAAPSEPPAQPPAKKEPVPTDDSDEDLREAAITIARSGINMNISSVKKQRTLELGEDETFTPFDYEAAPDPTVDTESRRKHSSFAPFQTGEARSFKKSVRGQLRPKSSKSFREGSKASGGNSSQQKRK